MVKGKKNFKEMADLLIELARSSRDYCYRIKPEVFWKASKQKQWLDSYVEAVGVELAEQDYVLFRTYLEGEEMFHISRVSSLPETPEFNYAEVLRIYEAM